MGLPPDKPAPSDDAASGGVKEQAQEVVTIKAPPPVDAPQDAPQQQAREAAGASADEAHHRCLPLAVETWAVQVNGVSHTYGEVHEMIHRDISIGNDYRKERVKHVTTLAAGVFAITVAFHKDMFGGHVTVPALISLLLGWLLLVGSLLAGIFHFEAWENYYLAFREVGNNLWRYRVATDPIAKKDAYDRFDAARSKVQGLQGSYRQWNRFQTWGLVIGLILIIVYVGLSSCTLIETPASPSRRMPPITEHSGGVPIISPSVQAPSAHLQQQPMSARPAPGESPASNQSR